MSTSKLIWTSEYSVGVDLIDKQHQQIFSIANDIIDSISTGITKERLEKNINSLIVYKEIHFETEESFFKVFNYEDAENHIASHKSFDLNIKKIKEDLSQDIFGTTFKLVDFIEDWLVGHIMGEDKKYTKCFHDHGLK